MKEKYFKLVYKHYDYSELEATPKSKFLRSLLASDDTTQYDFAITYKMPQNISEQEIKALFAYIYNAELKKAKITRKTNALEIKKFNEDFIAFMATEILDNLDFEIISEDKTDLADTITITLLNPNLKFWKNSIELEEFTSFIGINDKESLKRLIDKVNKDSDILSL